MTHRKTNPIPSRRFSTHRFCYLAVIALVFLVFSTTKTFAQAVTGTIGGTVADASTGKLLEGAEIALQGSDLHTTSVRQGSFELRNVPTGVQTLTISYGGLETKTETVTVTAGQRTDLPVKLVSGGDTITLTEFKVAGAKEGMAQAVALQKVAVNSKIVAAGDQYGDIAEGNAAEYLKFLPGVGIDYNANDARAVTLRGLSTSFTNVTEDGNPIASATSGNLNRRFEFEQVAINNVSAVEVVKTLTPEIPASSTGGIINFVTKSGFDSESNQLTYRAYFQAINDDLYLRKSEGWGQEKTRKVLPGIDLDYSTRIGQKWAIDIGYKNSQLYNDYPRSTYTWEYNPANGGSPTKPVMTSWNLQNEQKDTRRQAFSTRVDYHLDDHTKIFVAGQWSYYDLLFTDRTTTIATGALAPLATTSVPNPTPGTVNGLAGKGSATFLESNRWKSGVTWDTSVNLEHEFSNSSILNTSAYWSQAYSKYRDITGSWYADAAMARTGLTVGFDNVGSVVPSYRVTDANGATVNLQDITQGFNATQFRSRPQTGVDTRDGVNADYKIDLTTAIPISIKFGGRVDDSTRNIENRVLNRTTFSPAITGTALLPLVDTTFINHSIGYGLPAYSFLSPYASFTQLGGAGFLPYTPTADLVARFDDTTNAAYARIDITPIKNLLIVGGFRYEDRTTDSVNRQVASATAPQSAIGSRFTSKRVYPSVNVKYTGIKGFVFRLGYSKSIGLPDYDVLLPGTVVVEPTSSARGTITTYNPGIKEYLIDNFDAGVEYYFSHSGYVSASIFRKNISNYITKISQSVTTDTLTQLGINPANLGQPLDQYDLVENMNVKGTGHYNGLELGYAQNFTFLPKPFNTIGLQVNATLVSIDPIKTSQVFSTTEPNLNAAVLEQINKSLEIAAVKKAINVSLSYSLGKFGLNIESNYTGNVLKTVTRKTIKYSDVTANRYFNELQYQAPRELVDIRLDYKYSRLFTPYIQARNIFGRPIDMSTPILPINHAEYGDPIYEVGIRGVW